MSRKNYSWNNGIKQEDILKKIEVPCVYIHAKKTIAETGVPLCAATREQAERAVALIGDNCRLVETSTSDHLIHEVHKDLYMDDVNSLLESGGESSVKR